MPPLSDILLNPAKTEEFGEKLSSLIQDKFYCERLEIPKSNGRVHCV